MLLTFSKVVSKVMFAGLVFFVGGQIVLAAADSFVPQYSFSGLPAQPKSFQSVANSTAQAVIPSFESSKSMAASAAPASTLATNTSQAITPKFESGAVQDAAKTGTLTAEDAPADPASADATSEKPTEEPPPEKATLGLIPTSSAGLNKDLCFDLVDAFLIGDFQLWHIKCYAQYLINTLIFVAGGVAVLFVVIGGYQYVISGATEDKEAGKNTIKFALMGFAVVVLAWSLVNLWQTFLTGGDGVGETPIEAPAADNSTDSASETGAAAASNGDTTSSSKMPDAQSAIGAKMADGLMEKMNADDARGQ